jgi:hypothetical protein
LIFEFNGSVNFCYNKDAYKGETMSNTPETLDELITLLESVRTDYNKFYDDGNAAAGTRVRKAMQTVKTTAQDVRLHVQETKNQ